MNTCGEHENRKLSPVINIRVGSTLLDRYHPEPWHCVGMHEVGWSVPFLAALPR